MLIERERIKELNELLEECSASKTRNKFLHQMILDASKFGKPEIVKLALEYGANPNTKNFFGITALYRALHSNKSFEIIKLLLEAGASPNTEYILTECIDLNKLDEAMLLLDFGANIDATNEYSNPSIIEAFKRNNQEQLEFLVKNGADINFIGGDGKSVLDLAYDREKYDTVKLLKKTVSTNELSNNYIFNRLEIKLHNLINDKIHSIKLSKSIETLKFEDVKGIDLKEQGSLDCSTFLFLRVLAIIISIDIENLLFEDSLDEIRKFITKTPNTQRSRNLASYLLLFLIHQLTRTIKDFQNRSIGISNLCQLFLKKAREDHIINVYGGIVKSTGIKLIDFLELYQRASGATKSLKGRITASKLKKLSAELSNKSKTFSIFSTELIKEFNSLGQIKDNDLKNITDLVLNRWKMVLLEIYEPLFKDTIQEIRKDRNLILLYPTRVRKYGKQYYNRSTKKLSEFISLFGMSKHQINQVLINLKRTRRLVSKEFELRKKHDRVVIFNSLFRIPAILLLSVGSIAFFIGFVAYRLFRFIIGVPIDEFYWLGDIFLFSIKLLVPGALLFLVSLIIRSNLQKTFVAKLNKHIRQLDKLAFTRSSIDTNTIVK